MLANFFKKWCHSSISILCEHILRKTTHSSNDIVPTFVNDQQLFIVASYSNNFSFIQCDQNGWFLKSFF